MCVYKCESTYNTYNVYLFKLHEVVDLLLVVIVTAELAVLLSYKGTVTVYILVCQRIY